MKKGKMSKERYRTEIKVGEKVVVSMMRDQFDNDSVKNAVRLIAGGGGGGDG